MKISGVSNSADQNVQGGKVEQEDATTKYLKSKINDAQKYLQQLSENKDMSAEEKMKKRQEITKQISDLNNQLRQHQIELRQQKQQKQAINEQDMKQPRDKESGLEGNGRAGKTEKNNKGQAADTGLSEIAMQYLISADASVKQADVHGKVAGQLKGQAAVLKGEIKLDSGRGQSVEAKQNELSDVERKLDIASKARSKNLSKAKQKSSKLINSSNEKDDIDIKKKEKEEKLKEKKETESTSESESVIMEEAMKKHKPAHTQVDIWL